VAGTSLVVGGRFGRVHRPTWLREAAQ